eukprot:6373935-Prymnesium_polylepis.1
MKSPVAPLFEVAPPPMKSSPRVGLEHRQRLRPDWNAGRGPATKVLTSARRASSRVQRPLSQAQMPRW